MDMNVKNKNMCLIPDAELMIKEEYDEIEDIDNDAWKLYFQGMTELNHEIYIKEENTTNDCNNFKSTENLASNRNNFKNHETVTIPDHQPTTSLQSDVSKQIEVSKKLTFDKKIGSELSEIIKNVQTVVEKRFKNVHTPSSSIVQQQQQYAKDNTDEELILSDTSEDDTLSTSCDCNSASFEKYNEDDVEIISNESCSFRSTEDFSDDEINSEKRTLPQNQSTTNKPSKKIKLAKQTVDKEIRMQSSEIVRNVQAAINMRFINVDTASSTLRQQHEANDGVNTRVMLSDISENESSSNSFDDLLDAVPFREITERDVMLQQRIYKSLKHEWKRQQQLKRPQQNGNATFKIPNNYLESSKNNMELSPKCKFYIPITTFTLIEARFNEEKKWMSTVRETVLKVYGENIMYFSATGKGSGRPGINKKLFNGLFEWINRLNKRQDPPLPPVTRKEYVDFINHLSSNKRGYFKRKKK